MKRKEDLKILAVDDQMRMLESVQELVSAQGYNIDIARGGRAAIKRLEEGSYDVVFLDLMMHDLSGHDVMAHIRENDINVIVIVVSGDASIDAAIQALRAGAHDFLRKPYAPELLINTLENAVRHRLLEEENRDIQKKLKHSEKLYRFMVNNSPDIVYILDQDGCFVFINNRIESLLGYDRNELTGVHYSNLVFDDDLEMANYAFNERRRGERATHNVELRLKCKDERSSVRCFETDVVSIELSSMGLYQNRGESSEKEYIGTYGVARDISERKKAEEIIKYQAHHDLLTGLPNRILFLDRLEMSMAQARRRGKSLAVMFLDLDRFKFVNDTLGHVIGDRLLQAVGLRLRNSLRDGDTLSRHGGDEFTVLLPEVETRNDVDKVAGKIINELKMPFLVDGNELYINGSVGVTVYPDDGETGDELIKNADIAMYHIKSRGKGGHQFYAGDMQALFSQSLALEGDLRKAIDTDQFIVFYQPQYDARSGQLVAMEALIRWNHPTRGLLSPNEFIAHAEDTGLIIPIGEWLLRQVCADISEWRRKGLPDIQMAINLSALQIECHGFSDTLIGILNEYYLPGSCLEIEITENLLMKEMENAIHKLRKLSAHGISIAIDDFGTGYSSLSYLHKLPIDTVKIDRSFVHEVTPNNQDQSIIHAIIAMAKGLGLKTIAEGVESDYQHKVLLEAGCDMMQGYLYSQPIHSRDIEEYLAASSMAAKLPFPEVR
jgi:diguanylate cyclase (GGDEF)-like protein/PAS domain S-box-containing protein